jgi:hypothetical protein
VTFADLYTPLVADACVRSDKGSSNALSIAIFVPSHGRYSSLRSPGI